MGRTGTLSGINANKPVCVGVFLITWSQCTERATHTEIKLFVGR